MVVSFCRTDSAPWREYIIMRMSITHSTTYTYAQPVSLAAHVIRLRPRCDGALWLIHFDIRIEPRPSALSQCFDLEGNTVTHVASRSEVETLRTNASDYLLDPHAWRLPPRYTGGLERLLAPYSLRTQSDDHVDRFAQENCLRGRWEYPLFSRQS